LIYCLLIQSTGKKVALLTLLTV